MTRIWDYQPSVMSSIMIKNLDRSFEEEEVIEIFKRFGSIKSCFVGSDHDCQSLGFAIIQYMDPDSALSVVMRMNGKELRDTKVEVELLDLKLEAELRKPHKFTNLYFKHIRDYVREGDIEKLFSRFGDIKSVHIELDEDSNSKKFGFISFQEHSAALSALVSMQNEEILEVEPGQKLYLTPAKSKQERMLQKHEEIIENDNRFRNLYVKNLPEEADDDYLTELFEPFGTIESAKIMLDDNGNSRQFGFVCFGSIDSAKKAQLQMNAYPIANTDKKIYVSFSEKKDERKAKIESRLSNARFENMKTNLYVKNLESFVDDDYLRIIFERYGKVTSAKVVTDEKGSSREFGFVCFESPEVAQKAVEDMNNRVVLNKPLYVTFAEKKEEIIDKDNRFRNLYVKNLPEEADNDYLTELFEPFGTIESAKVMVDESGNSRQFGFVCFESMDCAKKAQLQMNAYPIANTDKKLYVSFSEKKDERKAKIESRLSNARFENMKTNLYVKNLESFVDDDYLRIIFERFGKVTSAKVMTDEKGSSREFGFVCFESPEVAQKAVEDMNNRVVLNKPLYVTFAEKKEERQARLTDMRTSRCSKG